MAMKPIVDGIDNEFEDRLEVIRLDVQKPEAKPFMEKYGFEFTPTFILFDAEGQETWRSVGSLDSGRLREVIAALP